MAPINTDTLDETLKKPNLAMLLRSPAQRRRATLKLAIEDAANIQKALSSFAAMAPRRKSRHDASSSSSNSINAPANGSGRKDSELRANEQQEAAQKRLSGFSHTASNVSEYLPRDMINHVT